jgi:hypothetical protein
MVREVVSWLTSGVVVVVVVGLMVHLRRLMS